MDELARFALVTFTSVLFIVDPVAAIPTYLVITQQETPVERRRTARRACIAMTLLLMFFAATGTMLFRAFGITLPAFRTAGGLILWYVAMDMLQGERRTQEGGKSWSRARPRRTSPLRRWLSRCWLGPVRSRPRSWLLGRLTDLQKQ